ncbi:MAG TPA: hypothetical protein PKC24_02035 [Cyclobacteriaceae bacterium]|nr:hypothetical protein [Cyclobacteriaceae bacterium]
MKGGTQYLIALAATVFAVFKYTQQDYREFTLYFMLGLAFAVLGLSREEKLKQHKWLPVLSWILVIATGIAFLYVLRTDN